MKKIFLAAVALVMVGAGCLSMRKSSTDTPPDYIEADPVKTPPATTSTATKSPPPPTGQMLAPGTLATKKDLVGAWRVIKAQTTGFDSIILESDGTYFSHLNDLPFDEGTWELAKATLILRPSYGDGGSIQFDKVHVDGNKLKLNDGVIPTVWQRVK